MDTPKNDKVILKGEAAIKKWKAGKDEWNKWVAENPNADVSFEQVNFALHRKGESEIAFAGYHFPNGDVDFSGAIFGDGYVDFSSATFGDGDVNFYRASFGDGYVNFDRASFGDGDVDFSGAIFGDGYVYFRDATFGNGDVNFNRASFGDSYVFFYGASFGDGYVFFNRAIFGDGDVSFRDATFGGATAFNVSTFGTGKLDLSGITAKSLDFEFSAHEKSAAPHSLYLSDFSLRKATIAGPLLLNHLTFNCIPDLRSTKISHHVDMTELKINLKRDRAGWQGFWHHNTNDVYAQAKLRRLKEIAEQFKHHEEALEFNALESKATRWVHEHSFFKNVLDMCYSFFSNYGRSVLRPLFALITTWLLFAGIYSYFAVKWCLTLRSYWDMFQLAAINSLPFVPIGKPLRDEVFTEYSLDLITGLSLIMGFQSLVSVVLIFLIGLGLRNQFRL